MWFAQQMYADPETMAYNAGWDVPSASYHPDTGCIDFPESQWGKKLAGSVGPGAGAVLRLPAGEENRGVCG